MLAERFSGTPDEPGAEGALPAFRLAVPDSGADEGGTPRSYDPSRRSVLTPSNLTVLLGFCYGQELGNAVVSREWRAYRATWALGVHEPACHMPWHGMAQPSVT